MAVKTDEITHNKRTYIKGNTFSDIKNKTKNCCLKGKMR